MSNQTAVAVVPRPEVRPDFGAVLGADIAHLRKRRALTARLRYLPPDAMPITPLPERKKAGRSGRATYREPRARKLDAEQMKAIQTADDRTLRELAEEFGVSHETIRKVRQASATSTS